MDYNIRLIHADVSGVIMQSCTTFIRKTVTSTLGYLFLAMWAASAFGQTIAPKPPSAKNVFKPAKAIKRSENMVASVHPLATRAGVNALRDGGNAVDAAIATALTLGVVDGFNSGIGGGCFILIRTSQGKFFAIDGREMAPAAAHRDMYLEQGKPVPGASQTGALAIGVPGALKAYEQAVKRHGKLPFEKLILPAAKIAESGFPITTDYHARLRGAASKLAQFPGSRSVLLEKDGKPKPVGTMLVQKDLANTYKMIAKRGPGWFYRGDFASRTETWMKKNGGIITAKDFAAYHTKNRTPIRTRYRDVEIVGFPPPSSGGVHVAQILNILESFDLGKIYREDPVQFHHLVAESMKLAFADRAYWLGDPDFAKVPLGLISKPYARSLAKRIVLDQVSKVDSYGTPPQAEGPFFERHTTHVAAADRQGNWVAITTTVNTTFGSKVIIPGLGVVMNNQMDDFSVAPGVPNAYGLVGSEANAVQAGKRPLSSMSPTIILRDGKPIMTIGAAGGPKIITQVLQAIVRHVDLGWTVDRAIGEPRIHHQWSPDRLLVERGFDAAIARKLEQKGHQIQWTTAAGVCQGIIWDPKHQWFTGTHDPRVQGKADGN